MFLSRLGRGETRALRIVPQVVFKSENCLACGIDYLLGAWPAFFISVWLFAVGVMGWHLWPLDSHSENARYNEIIIASKIGTDSPSSRARLELHENAFADLAR